MNILHTNTLCDLAKKQNLLLLERKLTADLCFVFSLIWWLPITFLGSGRHVPGAISKPEHKKAPFIPSLDSARFAETKRQFDFSMIWRSGQNLNENRWYTLRRGRSCICQFRLLFLFFVFFFFYEIFLISWICKYPFQIARNCQDDWSFLSREVKSAR